MDWNNDGNMDLVVSDTTARIWYAINTPVGGVPTFGALKPVNYTAGGQVINPIGKAAMWVVDWDNDGKKDIITGGEDDYSAGTGKCYFFRNTGSDAAPTFASPAVIGGGTDFGWRTSPVVVDWDGDGKKDIVTSSVWGEVRFFRNTGTDAAPAFSASHSTAPFVSTQSGNLDWGTETRIRLVYWDNDGRQDLLIGDRYGEVRLYVKNHPPQVDAGQDSYVRPGTLVSLSGSGTTDPENDSLMYRWSFIALPNGSTAAIANPDNVSASFVPDVVGTYQVQLSAADGHGAPATGTRTINVTAAIDAPVITGIISDTGISSTDGITSDRTLVINGTAEPNSTVTVTRVGSGVIGSCVANGSWAWSYDYTGTTLPAGNFSFTATATDSAGHVSPSSPAYDVRVDTTAPLVSGAIVNGGLAQRTKITSLAVSFSESVVCTAGDLTLTNLTTGQQFNLSGVPFDLATGTWDLSGVELTDGYYMAHMSAGAVEDLAGNLLLEDYTFSFHRLVGDTTGDTSVDAADYIALRCSLGTTGGPAWYTGDLDGDGDVDWSDLQTLAANVGASLAPAPALALTSPAVPTHADPAQAGVTAPTQFTVVPDSQATVVVVAAPELPAESAAEVQKATAEPQLAAAPVADAPGADVLAMVASILGNRLTAGNQGAPTVAVGPADSQPTVRAAVRVGSLSISPSPLLSRGRAGEAFADVLQLAGPWWSGDSAGNEPPDDPWMTRLAPDIAVKPRKDWFGMVDLDILVQ